MAFTIKIIDLKGILLLVLLTFPSKATNLDCNGKAFHCVNSTHFMICVDLGRGVSTTIDDYVIPCPATTVCRPTNHFECEFPAPVVPHQPTISTVRATETLSEVFNSQATTSIPFEEYYNTISTTPISHSDSQSSTLDSIVSIAPNILVHITNASKPGTKIQNVTQHSIQANVNPRPVDNINLNSSIKSNNSTNITNNIILIPNITSYQTTTEKNTRGTTTSVDVLDTRITDLPMTNTDYNLGNVSLSFNNFASEAIVIKEGLLTKDNQKLPENGSTTDLFLKDNTVILVPTLSTTINHVITENNETAVDSDTIPISTTGTSAENITFARNITTGFGSAATEPAVLTERALPKDVLELSVIESTTGHILLTTESVVSVEPTLLTTLNNLITENNVTFVNSNVISTPTTNNTDRNITSARTSTSTDSYSTATESTVITESLTKNVQEPAVTESITENVFIATDSIITVQPTENKVAIVASNAISSSTVTIASSNIVTTKNKISSDFNSTATELVVKSEELSSKKFEDLSVTGNTTEQVLITTDSILTEEPTFSTTLTNGITENKITVVDSNVISIATATSADTTETTTIKRPSTDLYMTSSEPTVITERLLPKDFKESSITGPTTEHVIVTTESIIIIKPTLSTTLENLITENNMTIVDSNVISTSTVASADSNRTTTRLRTSTDSYSAATEPQVITEGILTKHVQEPSVIDHTTEQNVILVDPNVIGTSTVTIADINSITTRKNTTADSYSAASNPTLTTEGLLTRYVQEPNTIGPTSEHILITTDSIVTAEPTLSTTIKNVITDNIVAPNHISTSTVTSADSNILPTINVMSSDFYVAATEPAVISEGLVIKNVQEPSVIGSATEHISITTDSIVTVEPILPTTLKNVITKNNVKVVDSIAISADSNITTARTSTDSYMATTEATVITEGLITKDLQEPSAVGPTTKHDVVTENNMTAVDSSFISTSIITSADRNKITTRNTTSTGSYIVATEPTVIIQELLSRDGQGSSVIGSTTGKKLSTSESIITGEPALSTNLKNMITENNETIMSSNVISTPTAISADSNITTEINNTSTEFYSGATEQTVYTVKLLTTDAQSLSVIESTTGHVVVTSDSIVTQAPTLSSTVNYVTSENNATIVNSTDANAVKTNAHVTSTEFYSTTAKPTMITKGLFSKHIQDNSLTESTTEVVMILADNNVAVTPTLLATVENVTTDWNVNVVDSNKINNTTNSAENSEKSSLDDTITINGNLNNQELFAKDNNLNTLVTESSISNNSDLITASDSNVIEASNVEAQNTINHQKNHNNVTNAAGNKFSTSSSPYYASIPNLSLASYDTTEISTITVNDSVPDYMEKIQTYMTNMPPTVVYNDATNNSNIESLGILENKAEDLVPKNILNETENKVNVLYLPAVTIRSMAANPNDSITTDNNSTLINTTTVVKKSTGHFYTYNKDSITINDGNDKISTVSGTPFKFMVDASNTIAARQTESFTSKVLNASITTRDTVSVANTEQSKSYRNGWVTVLGKTTMLNNTDTDSSPTAATLRVENTFSYDKNENVTDRSNDLNDTSANTTQKSETLRSNETNATENIYGYTIQNDVNIANLNTSTVNTSEMLLTAPEYSNIKSGYTSVSTNVLSNALTKDTPNVMHLLQENTFSTPKSMTWSQFSNEIHNHKTTTIIENTTKIPIGSEDEIFNTSLNLDFNSTNKLTIIGIPDTNYNETNGYRATLNRNPQNLIPINLSAFEFLDPAHTDLVSSTRDESAAVVVSTDAGLIITETSNVQTKQNIGNNAQLFKDLVSVMSGNIGINSLNSNSRPVTEYSETVVVKNTKNDSPNTKSTTSNQLYVEVNTRPTITVDRLLETSFSTNMDMTITESPYNPLIKSVKNTVNAVTTSEYNVIENLRSTPAVGTLSSSTSIAPVTNRTPTITLNTHSKKTDRNSSISSTIAHSPVDKLGVIIPTGFATHVMRNNVISTEGSPEYTKSTKSEVEVQATTFTTPNPRPQTETWKDEVNMNVNSGSKGQNTITIKPETVTAEIVDRQITQIAPSLTPSKVGMANEVVAGIKVLVDNNVESDKTHSGIVSFTTESPTSYKHSEIKYISDHKGMEGDEKPKKKAHVNNLHTREEILPVSENNNLKSTLNDLDNIHLALSIRDTSNYTESIKHKKDVATHKLIQNSAASTNSSHKSNITSKDQNNKSLDEHNTTVIINNQNSTPRYTSQATSTAASDAQTNEFPTYKPITSKPQLNKFSCKHKRRGRYSDEGDCRKFYICIGSSHIIEGSCPVNTVFSEIRKQCTKNLSHCIRNNQFRCTIEGRFSDFLNDNVYYICVKNNVSSFIRFKLQCQNGYLLNKTAVRCDVNKNWEQSTSTSKRDGSKNNSEQNASSMVTSAKMEEQDKSNKFKCKKEGVFADPSDCKRYFECRKSNNNVYRQKRKKCDSDEVFHKDKKECVDSESNECN